MTNHNPEPAASKLRADVQALRDRVSKGWGPWDKEWMLAALDGLLYEEPCGAWGGCQLPKGHNMGRADIPENHGGAEKSAAPPSDGLLLAVLDQLVAWQRIESSRQVTDTGAMWRCAAYGVVERHIRDKIAAAEARQAAAPSITPVDKAVSLLFQAHNYLSMAYPEEEEGYSDFLKESGAFLASWKAAAPQVKP